MLVFFEELFDVTRHQNVECPCGVIPVKFDSALEIARPISGKFVCLLYASYEVVRVFLIYIFHP